MKKIQIMSISIITLFSFFYTEKISKLTLEKNEIYQEIKQHSSEYEEKYVNAIIDDDKIIPGLNGRVVNIKNSFYNMIDLNTFNSYYLLYDATYPEVSLEKNKDKIVSQGNPQKKAVSFITNSNNKVTKYFKENNLPISILTKLDTFNKSSNFEQVNNETKNFNKLESLINKYSKNTNICYINDNNKKICKNHKKYLVRTNKVLNNQTFLEMKNNIASGDIYYIDNTIDTKNIRIFINSILYKDLDIISLSNMLSEEKNWFNVSFLV